MDQAGVYLIENGVTKKGYVGKATNPHRRAFQHWSALKRACHKNPHLQASYNIYGKDVFTFYVLEFVDVCPKCVDPVQHRADLAYLETREIWWAELLHSFSPHGYNLKRGGGANPSEESRAKLSRNASSRRPEVAAKIAATLRGHSVSESTRSKISRSLKGRPIPQSVIQKRSTSLKGRVVSEETRRKMSQARAGRPVSEDERQRLRNMAIGRPKSAEERRKLSAAHKGRLHSVTTRQKMSASKSKQWKLSTPDGLILLVTNLKQFCNEHGLSQSSMVYVADGKYSHHRGWKCERAFEKYDTQ
jgi:group I intron endonuclease